MKRALLVLFAIFACAAMGFAQDAPKAEIFGGYSYLRVEGVNANGWNAALTGNITKNFGITADFSGHYAQGGHAYTYVFGPQIGGEIGKARPFVHALFGANTTGASGVTSDTSYAIGFGGGLDVNAYKNLAIRLAQADYFRTNHGGVGQNSFRFSTGIVLKF